MLMMAIMGIAGLGGFIVTVLVLVFVMTAWFGQPVIFGNDDGPDQPIAYPHTIHAGTQPGQLGLDCTFCHRNVTKGAAATIPAVGLCLTCHKTVGDGNDEIEKLRAIAEAGDAIHWVRVHRVPDHVHFVHEAHISFFSERDGILPSAVCSTCHGDVASMTKVSQVKPLKMSDCVDCHRDNGAPTDCTTCHY